MKKNRRKRRSMNLYSKRKNNTMKKSTKRKKKKKYSKRIIRRYKGGADPPGDSGGSAGGSSGGNMDMNMKKYEDAIAKSKKINKSGMELLERLKRAQSDAIAEATQGSAEASAPEPAPDPAEVSLTQEDVDPVVKILDYFSKSERHDSKFTTTLEYEWNTKSCVDPDVGLFKQSQGEDVNVKVLREDEKKQKSLYTKIEAYNRHIPIYRVKVVCIIHTNEQHNLEVSGNLILTMGDGKVFDVLEIMKSDDRISGSTDIKLSDVCLYGVRNFKISEFGRGRVLIESDYTADIQRTESARVEIGNMTHKVQLASNCYYSKYMDGNIQMGTYNSTVEDYGRALGGVRKMVAHIMRDARQIEITEWYQEIILKKLFTESIDIPSFYLANKIINNMFAHQLLRFTNYACENAVGEACVYETLGFMYRFGHTLVYYSNKNTKTRASNFTFRYKAAFLSVDNKNYNKTIVGPFMKFQEEGDELCEVITRSLEIVKADELTSLNQHIEAHTGLLSIVIKEQVPNNPLIIFLKSVNELLSKLLIFNQYGWKKSGKSKLLLDIFEDDPELTQVFMQRSHEFDEKVIRASCRRLATKKDPIDPSVIKELRVGIKIPKQRKAVCDALMTLIDMSIEGLPQDEEEQKKLRDILYQTEIARCMFSVDCCDSDKLEGIGILGTHFFGRQPVKILDFAEKDSRDEMLDHCLCAIRNEKYKRNDILIQELLYQRFNISKVRDGSGREYGSRITLDNDHVSFVLITIDRYVQGFPTEEWLMPTEDIQNVLKIGKLSSITDDGYRYKYSFFLLLHLLLNNGYIYFTTEVNAMSKIRMGEGVSEADVLASSGLGPMGFVKNERAPNTQEILYCITTVERLILNLAKMIDAEYVSM